MFTQILKKTLFLRIISFIAAVSFVLSSVSVSYAYMDKLKPHVGKENPEIRDIQTDLRGRSPSLGNPIPIIDYYDKKLEGRKILMRADFNVPLDEKGNVTSDKRIREAIPTIAYAMKRGATIILGSHLGRPKGKVVKDLSMRPVAKRLAELLKEYGIPVVFLESSITEKGLAEGVKDKIVKGAVNVLENTRFCKGEEENEEAFAKALADLADGDIYVNDAFGSDESIHVSTAGVAKYTDHTALGFLMQKEYKYLKDALASLRVLIIGGGPKLDQKVPMVEHIIPNIKEGGSLVILSGPAPAFLKVLYGIEVGQKPSEEQIEGAKKIIKLAEERGVKILLPADFIAIDKDYSEVVDLETRKLSKDVSVYKVTLEQLKQGKFTDTTTGRELDASKLFLYDIGEKTLAELAKESERLQEGDAIFWNGPAGVFETAEFAEGTKGIGGILREATKRKRTTVIGGADTISAAEEFGFDADVTHCSTGGGASLALLQGKELKAVAELENIEIQKHADADKTIFAATGGEALRGYVNNIRPNLGEQKTALIVTPEVFRIGGINNALKELEGLSSGVKVALYGEKAEKIRDWIGNKEIITAKNLDELLTGLTSMGIGSANTIVLRAPKENTVDEAKFTERKIRQIVSGDIVTLAVAKAVKELVGNANADTAFRNFFSKIIEAQVVDKSVISENSKNRILAKFEEGTFTFPEDVRVTKKVDEDTKKARLITEEFMDNV